MTEDAKCPLCGLWLTGEHLEMCPGHESEEEKILRIRIPENAIGLHYCLLDENSDPLHDTERTIHVDDLEHAPLPEKDIQERYIDAQDNAGKADNIASRQFWYGYQFALAEAFRHLVEEKTILDGGCEADYQDYLDVKKLSEEKKEKED